MTDIVIAGESGELLTTTAAIAEVSRSSGRRTVVGVRLGDGRAQQAAAALAHGKRRE